MPAEPFDQSELTVATHVSVGVYSLALAVQDTGAGPLHVACQAGDVATVRVLLEAAPRLEARSALVNAATRAAGAGLDATPLYLCAKVGNEVVQGHSSGPKQRSWTLSGGRCQSTITLRRIRNHHQRVAVVPKL